MAFAVAFDFIEHLIGIPQQFCIIQKIMEMSAVSHVNRAIEPALPMQLNRKTKIFGEFGGLAFK